MKKRLFLILLHIFFQVGLILAQPVPGSYYEFMDAVKDMPAGHDKTSLIIYRPENKGVMNDIRCYLKLTDKNAIRQLEYIKQIYKPNGLIAIQDKKELRRLHNESPDFADCSMMALYAINYCSSSFIKHSFETESFVETEFDLFD